MTRLKGLKGVVSDFLAITVSSSFFISDPAFRSLPAELSKRPFISNISAVFRNVWMSSCGTIASPEYMNLIKYSSSLKLTSRRIMIGCWSYSTGASVFSNQLEQADRISWWHLIDFPSADKVTLQKSSASRNLLENYSVKTILHSFCSPECRSQLLIIICPSQHEVFVCLRHIWWSVPNFWTTFEILKALFCVWEVLFSKLLNAGCITFHFSNNDWNTATDDVDRTSHTGIMT